MHRAPAQVASVTKAPTLQRTLTGTNSQLDLHEAADTRSIERVKAMLEADRRLLAEKEAARDSGQAEDAAVGVARQQLAIHEALLSDLQTAHDEAVAAKSRKEQAERNRPSSPCGGSFSSGAPSRRSGCFNAVDVFSGARLPTSLPGLHVPSALHMPSALHVPSGLHMPSFRPSRMLGGPRTSAEQAAPAMAGSWRTLRRSVGVARALRQQPTSEPAENRYAPGDHGVVYRARHARISPEGDTEIAELEPIREPTSCRFAD